MRVTSSEIIDATRAVTVVDITDKEDFRLALRPTLTRGFDDLEKFDQLFDLFWGEAELDEELAPDEAAPEPGAPQIQDEKGEESLSQLTGEQAESLEATDDEAEQAVYSPMEVLTQKDFSSFRADEIARLARAVLLMAQKLATRYSRRMRQTRRGSLVDPRRTMRRSLRYGGTAVELLRKKRKIRKLRLVLLCDVSRSMDAYSRFLLQFIHAFQHALGRVESFVFSTSLTRVTDYFHTNDIYRALDRISREVPDWSGGTRIGLSLRAFNREFAPRVVNSNTVIIVLSDGLDTGDTELLESSMQELRRRARKLIWLNPLLGSPEYRPLARGMSAALPFVDFFAPAHNLASLEELGKHLTL